MMRHRLVVLLAVMIVGTALSVPSHAQSAGYDLLQQALRKERAEGRLEEAIALYEGVVDEFAGDRTLAGRAVLGLGRCYGALRLGDGPSSASTWYDTT